MGYLPARIRERIENKKSRLDAYHPLPQELLLNLKSRLTIEYTYNSNAIDGNSLSYEDTFRVIENGVTVGGKSLKEHLEARNFPGALNFLKGIINDKHMIDETVVLGIHRFLMMGITNEAGEYRRWGVKLEDHRYDPPRSKDVPELVQSLLLWLRRNPDELKPIELAAVIHYRFSQIHPFQQGNLKVARLLMNCVLMENGYPYITIIPVIEQRKYIKGLREANQGNPSKLVRLVAQCTENCLDEYLHELEKPEIISLKKAANMSPYSQEYLSLLSRRGLLGAFKIGRIWHTTKRDLERYVQSLSDP